MHLPPPSEWHVADICLLPKPHKPVAGPETLRPISLLHPVAKALATIINGRIKPNLLQLVDGLPQFSYLEGRSVQDALDRAMAHCTRVRSILNAQRQNVHLKKQGHAPSPCRGGITLSLDLQQAFDLMPRDRLLEAMQLAGIDYSLQYAIMQLHYHAQMRVTHGGQSAVIETANGVRQGCGLAPSLWCLFTCLILQHVNQQVALSDTTAYADDFLFQWIVDTPAQFDQACEHISFILRTFARFGMKVSHTKTVVLMALKGPLAGSTARAHVRRDPQKGKCLRVALHDKLQGLAGQCSYMLLPIVVNHTYLGAKLSYTQPEALTLKERMRNSWAAFNRLLPTLRTAGLSLQQRVQVWRTCVCTCLIHSLDSVGFAPGGALIFRKHVVRQLRMLSKAPAHLTHESSEQLLRRLDVVDPVKHLARQVKSRLDYCRQGHKAQLQPPPVHRWWQQLEACMLHAQADPGLVKHTDALKAPARLVAVAEPLDPKPCPVCGLYYPDIRTLRIHMSQKHVGGQISQPRVRRAQADMRRDFMKHSLAGMPTCRHCSWQFTTWPSFCQHFERERCTVLHAQTAQPLPAKSPEEPTLTSQHDAPAQHATPGPDEQSPRTLSCMFPATAPDLLEIALKSDWQAVAAAVRNTDMHHCPVCNQWLAHVGYLSRHIKSQHAEIHNLQSAVTVWLQQKPTSVLSPCQFCGLDYKARHCSRPRHTQSCPVLYRTSLLIVCVQHLRQAQHGGSESADPHGGGPHLGRGSDEAHAEYDGDDCGPQTAGDGDSQRTAGPSGGVCEALAAKHGGPLARYFLTGGPDPSGDGHLLQAQKGSCGRGPGRPNSDYQAPSREGDRGGCRTTPARATRSGPAWTPRATPGNPEMVSIGTATIGRLAKLAADPDKHASPAIGAMPADRNAPTAPTGTSAPETRSRHCSTSARL